MSHTQPCRPHRAALLDPCTGNEGRGAPLLALCCLAHKRTHFLQIRQHFQSFLTGAVVIGGYGYFRVHQDVWYAEQAVSQRR